MKGLFAVVVCLLACSLYYRLIVNTAFVEIELEVNEKSEFKIYWAEKGAPFSEKNMSVAKVTPERCCYSFFLTDIGKVERLRVDTHKYAGRATLRKIYLQQEGWEPIELSTPEDFGRLVPLNDIVDFEIGDGIIVDSSGEDPNFEWVITPLHRGLDYAWLLLRMGCIVVFVLLVVCCGAPLVKDLRFVPILLFGVLMLIVVMASISKRNVHPDEYVHLNATAYYQDNWLPPPIEDPTIRNTYSVYGESRLNNSEVYYLFAGKFSRFMQPFKLADFLSMRMFNVVLFSIIFFYTVKNRFARMVALPLLISPQLWYLFSYCNSDAFALFVTFLAGAEAVDPESLLHRYLKGEGWGARIAGVLVLPLLLGIMFLLKKNYYPFIAFFYLCLVIKLFRGAEFYWERKEAVVRLVMITIIGAAVFGLRHGADYMVNGPDREEKLAVVREETADPLYKPSTTLAEKHAFLSRRDRGATLMEIIVKDRWFERSFQSSFGVFGYFTVSASQIYYDLVRWTGVGLLVFFFGSIVIRGGLAGISLSLAMLGLSAALIGASLHHSWVFDFQPQGRYLFPLVPMSGLLYGMQQNAVNKQILLLGVGSMYLLGLYCFIFEALLKIPKVVF
ncbi:MAG: hypothetical protein ACWGOX_00135 [Desulforhopalus sp.]